MMWLAAAFFLTGAAAHVVALWRATGRHLRSGWLLAGLAVLLYVAGVYVVLSALVPS